MESKIKTEFNSRQKSKLILMACMFFLVYACDEEERGQYPTNSGVPGKVTSAEVVENFAGGSVIVYDIPPEEDAHYVRACYTLDDGTPMELKASVYTNRITIVGIGRSRELPVVLTVVNHSQKESEPVTVNAHPLDSPVYDIAASMRIQEDFGGIALRWDNPTKIPVVIDVFTPESDGEMRQVDRFYSGAEAGRANVREQEPVETLFAVTVRDQWGNSIDLLAEPFTPIKEERLDKDLFRRWNPPGLPYNNQESFAWAQIENLWDDDWYQGGTNYDNAGVWAALNGYFTFDMGQVAKISRFKLYQRPHPTFIYNFTSCKRFALYGSTTPNVTDDISTWQFLGYFESFKPSGLPLGVNTDEDVRYAAIDGEDFAVEDSPAVRYLYLRLIENWGGGDRVQYSEMTIWGNVQE